MMEPSEKIKQIIYRKLRVQLDIACQKPYLLPHLLWFLLYLMPGNIDFSLRRTDNGGNASERGRLSCPVRPQQPVDLPRHRPEA